MSRLVEVVAGIAVRDGRILLAQRPAGKDFPFTWECPGGKVDGPQESHHSALRREWREELGVDVGALPEQDVWSGQFDNIVVRADRRSILLIFYFIGEHFTGTPVPREGQGFAWFTREQMRALPLAPGNARAFDAISTSAFGPVRE